MFTAVSDRITYWSSATGTALTGFVEAAVEATAFAIGSAIVATLLIGLFQTGMIALLAGPHGLMIFLPLLLIL